MLTCDPQHTKHLSDVEFEVMINFDTFLCKFLYYVLMHYDLFQKFKCMMDACISHVIGSCAISASSGSTVYTPSSQRPRVSFNSSNVS